MASIMVPAYPDSLKSACAASRMRCLVFSACSARRVRGFLELLTRSISIQYHCVNTCDLYRGHRARRGIPWPISRWLLPRTALINVNMQQCFVEEQPAGLAGRARGRRPRQPAGGACRAAGILVIHTRGWMRPDGSNLGVMAKLVPP